MIREDRFVLSHRPYAVDLSSLCLDDPHRITVRAAWFRRRNGITAACVGVLWDIQDPAPVDAAKFLLQATDGRYGGDCLGRWDGERYWGSQDPAEIERHLALLRPMLANYPAIPDGWDGWWTFRGGAR